MESVYRTEWIMAFIAMLNKQRVESFQMYLQAKGLSHISWAEVTSTPCNSELEESHINWAKVTSKYQNPNGTPAFKECCYISKNEENIAHAEVFTYV